MLSFQVGSNDRTQWTIRADEILFRNANDSTSAYDLMVGLFQIPCLKSLVVSMVDALIIPHSGDVQGKLIEGTYRVLDQARAALAASQVWGTVKMDRDDRQIFAEAAHVIWFYDADSEVQMAIKPEKMLMPRQHDDRGDDLWATFRSAT